MSDYYLDVVSRVADLPLFAQPAARKSDKPLSGVDERDKGCEQVVRSSGSEWLEDAIRIVRLRFAGCEVLAERFRQQCEEDGVRPSHPNAWGALTNVLVRRGVIEQTGRLEQSRDPNSHARRQPVWRVVG